MGVQIGSTPHPVPVHTRIILFLVGDPYKPSFATVTAADSMTIPNSAADVCQEAGRQKFFLTFLTGFHLNF